MSKLLNTVLRLIILAKVAKKQLEQGKYASTKRLLRRIMKWEQRELAGLQAEANSEVFYRDCIAVFLETKEAFQDLSNFNQAKALEVLDKVIALEQHQLQNIVQAKKGLPPEILKTIDPYIRKLMQEINTLSFVKQTTFSCSGHFPRESDKGYFGIEYDWDSPTSHNIQPFHQALAAIFGEAGILKPVDEQNAELIKVPGMVARGMKLFYYLDFPIKLPRERSQEDLRAEVQRQWFLIGQLVKKYQDRDFSQEKRKIKFFPHIKVLGKPKPLVERELLYLNCPRCRQLSLFSAGNKDRKCPVCGFNVKETFIVPGFLEDRSRNKLSL